MLATATSLPEVSMVLAAVRLKRYEMAISDVLSTNLFNVMIIVLVDANHSGEPVFTAQELLCSINYDEWVRANLLGAVLPSK